MNNFCRFCGEKLKKDQKKCLRCGTEVIEERINVEEKKKELESFQKNEKTIFIISSILLIITILILLLQTNNIRQNIPYKINDILKSVLPIIVLANTVLTSYGFIDYKKSIKIKITFFINLAILILFLLYYIYTIIAIIAIFALCL